MIIAVDFDQTLSIGEYEYPLCGEPNIPLIERLISAREKGDELILWTCRCGNPLIVAVEWCKQYGLEFDKVNEHIPRLIECFGNNTRKIYADVYIDDRNISIDEYTQK